MHRVRAMISGDYGKGDCFAIPLATGGYAVGVIARQQRAKRTGGKVALGYFFGPRHPQIPSLEKIGSLVATDARLVCRFGDLGLYSGEWTRIGTLLNWSDINWPMPTFYRRQLVSGLILAVRYADNDPTKCISEVVVSGQADLSEPLDGLFGSAAVQSRLDQILPVLQ
jgi:hypothetical protein